MIKRILKFTAFNSLVVVNYLGAIARMIHHAGDSINTVGWEGMIYALGFILMHIIAGTLLLAVEVECWREKYGNK